MQLLVTLILATFSYIVLGHSNSTFSSFGGALNRNDYRGKPAAAMLQRIVKESKNLLQEKDIIKNAASSSYHPSFANFYWTNEDNCKDTSRSKES